MDSNEVQWWKMRLDAHEGLVFLNVIPELAKAAPDRAPPRSGHNTRGSTGSRTWLGRSSLDL